MLFLTLSRRRVKFQPPFVRVHFDVSILAIIFLILDLNPVNGATMGTFEGDEQIGDCPAATDTDACEDICPEGVCDFSSTVLPLCLCNRISPGGPQYTCSIATLAAGGPNPCDQFFGFIEAGPTIFNCISTTSTPAAICVLSDNTLSQLIPVTGTSDAPTASTSSTAVAVTTGQPVVSNAGGLINCARLPYTSVGEALFCLFAKVVVKLNLLFLPKKLLLVLAAVVKGIIFLVKKLTVLGSTGIIIPLGVVGK